MSFRWLQDPEGYEHPRLSWLIEIMFALVLGWLFRVEDDVPQAYESARGCLLVSNHQRDSDAPILGRLMFRRRGLHLRGPLPFFAMREDLYQREGLANLLSAGPPALVHLLSWIPLRWLFVNVRTYPMRRLREFTWHDTLRELKRAGLGGADPGDVFNARGRRELRQYLDALPKRVDAINPWKLRRMRVAHWGLRRLQLGTLRRIAPGFRETVTQQLHFFAHQLDAGHNVYFAPEGHISMDGRFGRIRAGTWRLGRMTAQPLRLLPFAISYDPLGPGRTRVVVFHGDSLDDMDFGDTRAFAQRLRCELMTHCAVTPSHLLAHFLSFRDTPFGVHELAAWMRQAVVRARQAAIPVDPLFDRVVLDKLVDERVRWLGRKRLVWATRGKWQRRWSPETAPSWTRAEGMVRYLADSLSDFAPDYARALSQ